MPYSGRDCAGGNTIIVKGLRPKVEPLRKIGTPLWREETVQDVEKIYFIVL